ncbi:unnamed protein product [Parnassius mnemosyne]|uniref:MADF domain-containing protein n=1 Tax=Parnassius mnemosyne TaxID=213953 RepID=A0AAV1M6R0_9NEOP
MKDDLAFNIKFSELVHERPCLYDYTRPDYSNRNAQDGSWLEIAKTVEESVADCKGRWKNLRGCYTRHLKNNNRPSSSSAKHVKPYYLADHLQFLDRYIKSRQ